MALIVSPLRTGPMIRQNEPNTDRGGRRERRHLARALRREFHRANSQEQAELRRDLELIARPWHWRRS